MGKDNVLNTNRGLRIGLTVLFSFLAFFCFISFLTAYSFRKLVQYDYVSELNERVDIEKIVVEKIAESIGDGIVDPDGTMAEAISDVASDKLGVEIDPDVVDEVLEDKEILSDFVGYAAGVTAASENGEVDFNALAQGFLDIVEKHGDVIGDISGYEINEESMGQIKDTIDALEEPISSIQEQISPETVQENTGVDITGVEEYSQSTKDKLGKINEISSLISGGSARISFWTGRLLIYGVLALGIILCGVIIFINNSVLSDGFRGCGIVCIIAGTFNAVGALVLKILSTMTGFISDMINDHFPDVSVLGDAVGEVLADALNTVAIAALIPSLIFLIGGLGLMIASGVSLSREREKRIRERVEG